MKKNLTKFFWKLEALQQMEMAFNPNKLDITLISSKPEI